MFLLLMPKWLAILVILFFSIGHLVFHSSLSLMTDFFMASEYFLYFGVFGFLEGLGLGFSTCEEAVDHV